MKDKIKQIAKNNRLAIIGVFLGTIGGFLYWKFVGCSSGTCAITSNPYRSSAYGALMGGLLLSLFQKDKKQINKN